MEPQAHKTNSETCMQMAKATRFRLCPGFKDVPETLPLSGAGVHL